MFEVRLQVPIDSEITVERLTDIDNAAIAAVGRHGDWSGCGCGFRDIGWMAETLDEAVRMRAALTPIGNATVCEGTTYP